MSSFNKSSKYHNWFLMAVFLPLLASSMKTLTTTLLQIPGVDPTLRLLDFWTLDLYYPNLSNTGTLTVTLVPAATPFSSCKSSNINGSTFKPAQSTSNRSLVTSIAVEV